MTARTYANAEIVWPSGERTKVPSMRVEFREDPLLSAPRPLSFSGEMRFATMRIAHEAKVGAAEVAKVASLLRRLRAPRICWKCYDGRTRSHNRRCARRGRRAEANGA